MNKEELIRAVSQETSRIIPQDKILKKVSLLFKIANCDFEQQRTNDKQITLFYRVN